ncbi:MAG TPA: enolase C-terminal domain-like protein [Kofleriaceae bacterium]|jgi:L-alanine-DL-glutamate epimerase-like enolase superfamily enzyme|nr:enolase C-terminal domain-like protein [Kofleriaceae bacterium]
MPAPAIDGLDVRACRLPTEYGRESDGTAEWDATTMVIARPRAGGITGLGYSYVDAAAAAVIRDLLAPAIRGLPAFALAMAMTAMLGAVRNHGRPGLVACAISAVDIGLWDLKAKLLDVSLASLLGAARTSVPVYASGGFTSSDLDQLASELAGYAAAGHRRVKIKVGREPAIDPDRVRVAREAIGRDVELMVDANGGYARKQALAMAEQFAAHGVVYFEEPVPSDDLEGLRLVRDRAPAGMAIAAGEYGYDAPYFRRMLEAGAVDILQADATRALGITGFLGANALCAARSLPLSAHCAPAIHAHAGAAATQLVHLEQFRDHVRMEEILFEGAPRVVGGAVAFDPARAGLGLVLRDGEAARHAA